MYKYKIMLGCLLFVLLWSSGWIGAKYGQDYTGTFTLLAYRYMLVVAALFAFVSFTKSWRVVPRYQFLLHMCVGILSHAVYLGAGNSALLLGVSAGIVSFITALQPMITATMSSRISGESANYRQWFGLALGLTAILLVISDKIVLGGSSFAYSLPFFAIVAISIASLIDRRISLQKQSANAEPTPLSLITLIHCSSALLVMVPAAAFLEGFEAQWGGELVFAILWLAFVVSIGAYGMMFYMLRILSAIKVASLVYLAPPTTMIIAYFMFGERLTIVDIGGIALAGIAVWLVISNQNSEKLVSTLVTQCNPLLEPPKFKAQGLLTKNHSPDTQRLLRSDTRLSSAGIDIDLGAQSDRLSIVNNKKEQLQAVDLNIQILRAEKRSREKEQRNRITQTSSSFFPKICIEQPLDEAGTTVRLYSSKRWKVVRSSASCSKVGGILVLILKRYILQQNYAFIKRTRSGRSFSLNNPQFQISKNTRGA